MEPFVNNINRFDFSKFHWNTLVGIIAKKGYNPIEFKREVTSENMGHQTVIHFNGKTPVDIDEITEYYFVIHTDQHEGSYHVGSFPASGQSGFMGEAVYSWESVVERFDIWLTRLSEEIDKPDLWSMYERDWMDAHEALANYVSLPQVPGPMDRPLSANEESRFSDAVNSLQQAILALAEQQNKAAELISINLEAIREAGKARPRGVILGILGQILTSVATDLGKDAAKEIGTLAQELVIPSLLP